MKGRESRRLGGWGFLLVEVCRGKEGCFFSEKMGDRRWEMGRKANRNFQRPTFNFEVWEEGSSASEVGFDTDTDSDLDF